MKASILGFSLFFMFGFKVFANDHQIVSDEDVSFKLQNGRSQLQTKGRVSFHFDARQSGLRRGKVTAKQFNVLLKNVTQEFLTGKPARQKKGAVGFQLDSSGQLLEYNEGTVKGQLKGYVSFPQIRELTSPGSTRGGHEFFYPQLPAIVDLEWTSSPLDLLTGCGPAPIMIRYRIGIRILPNPLTGEQEVLSWTDSEVVGGSYGCLGETHVGRELCVVPIKIKDSNSDASPTGDGLGFGWPGVEEQWHKSQVRFDLKPFQTIVAPDLKTVSQNEMPDLLATFDVDDCVEVFFAEQFSPAALFGGGATFGSGTSEAKVISSDENANDIDFTHLAHELGHVMGLTHPGDGNPSTARPNVIDGSTGTLMCPSGFRNDNPDRNSEENGDNLSNPLFKLKLRRGSPQGADCSASSDCGSC